MMIVDYLAEIVVADSVVRSFNAIAFYLDIAGKRCCCLDRGKRSHHADSHIDMLAQEGY